MSRCPFRLSLLLCFGPVPFRRVVGVLRCDRLMPHGEGGPRVLVRESGPRERPLLHSKVSWSRSSPSWALGLAGRGGAWSTVNGRFGSGKVLFQVEVDSFRLILPFVSLRRMSGCGVFTSRVVIKCTFSNLVLSFVIDFSPLRTVVVLRSEPTIETWLLL